MERITIHTAHNVLLVSEVASVAERIVAALLDYIFIGVYETIVFIILKYMNTNSITLVILLVSPAIFYSIIMETANEGQSLGKMILHIKVIRMDGSQAGFVEYFIRWIFRLIDIIAFGGGIAVLTVIISGKGQRLGDIAAKTTVISTKPKTRLDDTMYANVPEDYDLQYPDVKRLTEEEIQIIRDVVNYYKQNENSTLANSMTNQVKNRIENKLNITSNKKPVEFLNVLLMDYNFLHKG